MNTSETVMHILDVAQELAQKRGYHGFSYRDISEQIGIKTSSIHYHFPNKGDLGRALVERYRASFQRAFVQIDLTEQNARMKLRRYVELFRQTLADEGRVCLCGMLATDSLTLPAIVTEEVQEFFAENEAWLTQVLEEGQHAHLFRSDIRAAKEAAALFAALEGAMMIARGFGDTERFTQTSAALLASLEV